MASGSSPSSSLRTSLWGLSVSAYLLLIIVSKVWVLCFIKYGSTWQVLYYFDFCWWDILYMQWTYSQYHCTGHIYLVYRQHEYHSQHSLSRKLCQKLILIMYSKPVKGKLLAMAIKIRNRSKDGCTRPKAEQGKGDRIILETI